MTVQQTHPTTTNPELPTYVGFDCHRDIHVAAVVDARGAELEIVEFPTTTAGVTQAVTWVTDHAAAIVGVEGTGSYGKSLCRALQRAGFDVRDVAAGDRLDRGRTGKDDAVDALSAARAVAAGRCSIIAKADDPDRDALSHLYRARSGAAKARRDAIKSLRALVVSAPNAVREQLRNLTAIRLVAACSAFRPATGDPTTRGARQALRSIARRIEFLDAEMAELEVSIAELVQALAPELVEMVGVGPVNAAGILVETGDVARFDSQDAYAHNAGTTPVPASSGLTTKHRLHRGGNRRLNCICYQIVIIRMAHDDRTREYIRRKLAEGHTKRDAIRCCKRYVAREIYQVLSHPQRVSPTSLHI